MGESNENKTIVNFPKLWCNKLQNFKKENI